MKKLLIASALACVMMFAGCGGSGKNESMQETENTNETVETVREEASEAVSETESTEGKTLIAYFSNTGNTESVALKLGEVTGGDVYKIEASVPYTQEDLDYSNDNCRANQEQNAPDARPEIAGSVENMDEYDTVFIGYPIWWGDAPKIMCTFVESYDFTGKTVIPFCTSGGSGISTSENTLSSLSQGDWLEGQRFDSGVSEDELSQWIDSLGI